MAAIFLDRDGIINQSVVRDGKPFPPQTLDEFQWTPNIQSTLRTLHERGHQLFIFTNQPDVARGTQTLEQVQAFHDMICEELPIQEVYACFHDNVDQCDCRKPKPGMLLQAQKKYQLDLTTSYAIGDRWRDIDAGNAVGCHTIFMDYGYSETLKTPPDHTIGDLSELLNIIP